MTGPPAADGVLLVSCRRASGSVSAGLVVGGCIHLVAAAIFVVMWHLQRATAPMCFPDEDGVFLTLVLALTADALGAVTWGVAARRRRRFMWGLVLAWLVGLIAVATGTLDILAFIESLGMGCSDSYRTPW
ncbi:hypothetical protein ONA91_33115 [Micromonospora sp. DR5-3]|uniref:hypothetical protein n=1 Tax=Micromonospora sp. DR5-3 TaxID=2992129 RepID=UPI0022317B21|nr:hypothetical protein [Micromonospora sp. DR5-3]MCW3819294.1 hypothetical protein [Micromonospora sp. DR5-3]